MNKENFNMESTTYLIKHRHHKNGPLYTSIVVINNDALIEDIVKEKNCGFGIIIEEIRPLTDKNYTIHLN